MIVQASLGGSGGGGGGGTVTTVTGTAPIVITGNPSVNPNVTYVAPYLVYTFLMNQSGTNAPVPTILQNTIGTIVWTRDSAGVFTGTLSGAFTANKTFLPQYGESSLYDVELIYGDDGTSSGRGVSFMRNDANTVKLFTLASIETFDDDILVNYPLEIRVYP